MRMISGGGGERSQGGSCEGSLAKAGDVESTWIAGDQVSQHLQSLLIILAIIFCVINNCVFTKHAWVGENIMI